MSNGQSSDNGSFFRSPWLWGGCGCCFGCLLIPIALVTLAGGGAFWAVRESGIQQEVLERVRASPAVIAEFGEPIETGWMVEGSININPGGGEADYSVPLEGPNASGRVYVVAQREGGEWQFEELYVVVDGSGARIDLLTGGAVVFDKKPRRRRRVDDASVMGRRASLPGDARSLCAA